MTHQMATFTTSKFIEGKGGSTLSWNGLSNGGDY